MNDQPGFLAAGRQTATRRPVHVRISDWKEVYEPFGHDSLERQAGRCMDCGIPFCHLGCPLGNLMPEWNVLVRQGRWHEAAERLHATNNFPEFTGRLCPAPCESACVLGINAEPVAIKQVEVEVVDRAWDQGWVGPQVPSADARAAGSPVAVIGSGPAGLAAAQQLTRAGHAVTVYEQADAPGGLLRYGIPEFKLEKWRLDRRLNQMRAEGTTFACGVQVGADVSAAQLRQSYRAIVLAGGSRVPRGLDVPGAGLDGIYQAIDFLTMANRGLDRPPASARGRHVVVIGGGDTGADCLGTALRQGAESVTQLEILPRPPMERPADQPWPAYPMIYRVSSAHEEGGERLYAVSTQAFLADPAGRVRALVLADAELVGGRIVVRPGTEREVPCDLVLLAMGFVGADDNGLLGELGAGLDQRGRVSRDEDYRAGPPGVFVAGDMGRGQSLIVWAIAEGRSAAAAVDRYLAGRGVLPVTVRASAAPVSLRPAPAATRERSGG